MHTSSLSLCELLFTIAVRTLLRQLMTTTTAQFVEFAKPNLGRCATQVVALNIHLKSCHEYLYFLQNQLAPAAARCSNHCVLLLLMPAQCLPAQKKRQVPQHKCMTRHAVLAGEPQACRPSRAVTAQPPYQQCTRSCRSAHHNSHCWESETTTKAP